MREETHITTTPHTSIGFYISLVPMRPLPRFRVTLKTWEWPGDKATSIYLHVSYDRMNISMYRYMYTQHEMYMYMYVHAHGTYIIIMFRTMVYYGSNSERESVEDVS